MSMQPARAVHPQDLSKKDVEYRQMLSFLVHVLRFVAILFSKRIYIALYIALFSAPEHSPRLRFDSRLFVFPQSAET